MKRSSRTIGRIESIWLSFFSVFLAIVLILPSVNVYAAAIETSTTIASSKISAAYGKSVTFTATVSPDNATGTVTFKDGSTTLGSNTVSSGKATYSTSSLSVGSHTIKAYFDASDTTFSDSTSDAITQTITAALAISTMVVRPGFVDMAYSQALAATGGGSGQTWSKSGTLPAGLSLSSTGVISGSPDEAGKYTFNVTVTDANSDTDTQSLTIVVNAPGYLYNWGDNAYGQLGNDSTASSSLPIPPNDQDDDDIIAMATGGQHVLAVNEDGEAYAWGYNDNGQLGNNSATTQKEPDQVNDLENAIAVAAGFKHSLALDVDGNVWAWGDNVYGQLGIDSATDKDEPVQIDESDLEDVAALAAGYYHSLALKDDGTVWTWGYNNKGQLGINSTTNKDIPTQVSGGEQEGTYLVDIVAIAAGNYYCLALDKNGALWAWGDNSAGQLGNGKKSTTSKTPVQVDDLEDVIAIAAGANHSLALDAGGDVYAWGDNGYGQLGNGSTTDETTPSQVDDIDDIVSIAAGSNHCLAVDEDGDLYLWGYNNKGQLGLGNTTNADTPEKVDDVDGNALAICGGGSVSLLINSEEIEISEVTITTSSLDDGTVDDAYSDTLGASGGSGDYKWTKSSGTLPSGLTLNSTSGKLSGTPTKAGEFTFTIKAADADDSSSYDTAEFTIEIESDSSSEDSVSIETTSLKNGKVNTDYSATLSAEGGSGSYLWYKNSGTLPAGLSLNESTGKISGTPTAEGTYNFKIKVVDEDDSSLSATASFSILIEANETTTSVSLGGLNASSTLEVSSKGNAGAAVQLTTLDKKFVLEIDKGTSLLDSAGKPLASIDAAVLSGVSSLPTGATLVAAYDLGPQGAKFNPALKGVFKYVKENLPSGISESELYIAIYDGTQWTRLPGTQDANKSTVSANIDHFSTYALLGKSSPTTTSTTTGTTTTTPTPTGSQTTTSQPATTQPAGEGGFNWWLVIGIVAGVLVLLIIVLIIVQRKKGLH